MMILGVDISQHDFHVHLLEGEPGQTFKTLGSPRAFLNTSAGHQQLEKWFGKHARANEVHAVMEATGVYWEACAQHLHRAGCMVSVVNPAQIKFFARSTLRRGKTDQMDAQIIAQYGATMRPKLWSPPSVTLETIKLLCRERQTVVGLVTRAKNHLHALNHRFEAHERVLELARARLSFLESQVEAIEVELRERCKADPLVNKQLELLVSIPGLGFIAAITILAETGGLGTFEDGRQLTAYAGLSPAPHQSGSSLGRAGISRVGNTRLRRIAYLAAVAASRSRSRFKLYYASLKGRGKPSKVALIALAGKLLRTALAVVRSGRAFDDGFTKAAVVIT